MANTLLDLREAETWHRPKPVARGRGNEAKLRMGAKCGHGSGQRRGGLAALADKGTLIPGAFLALDDDAANVSIDTSRGADACAALRGRALMP